MPSDTLAPLLRYVTAAYDAWGATLRFQGQFLSFVFLSFVLLPSRSIGAVFVRVHSQRFIAQPIFDALILAVDQSVSGGALSLSLSVLCAALLLSDDYFSANRRKYRVEFPSLVGASTLSSGSTDSRINRTIPVA